MGFRSQHFREANHDGYKTVSQLCKAVSDGLVVRWNASGSGFTAGRDSLTDPGFGREPGLSVEGASSHTMACIKNDGPGVEKTGPSPGDGGASVAAAQ